MIELLAATYLIYRALRRESKVAKKDMDFHKPSGRSFLLSPGVSVREYDISYVMKKETK